MKNLIAVVILSAIALSAAQNCDPKIVEWFPHQYSCQKYVICFHGNAIERDCAPGLHFSAVELKCMRPEDAKCNDSHLCPLEDDIENPTFLPDGTDCSRYFVCFKGEPVMRNCAEGFWWDVNYQWCDFPEKVTCDERTPNNPNPITTTSPPLITTTSPPLITTTERVPGDNPILDGCFRTEDLYDSDSESYLKSLCMFNTARNYEQSESICRDNNMELFVINNRQVESAFFTATTSILENWPRGSVWINGRRESEEWFTFNPNRAQLFDEIEWVQTETIDGRTTGDCLRYSAQHGPYQAMGIPCTTSHWFTCEYIKPPPLNTDICWSKHELIDESGAYLKSMCIINPSQNHAAAQESCRLNGMQLFVINNSTVQEAFLKQTTEALIRQPGGFVWINGQRDAETGEWFVYTSVRRPLYETVEWVQTATIDGRTSGDCLRYTSQHGPYQAMGVSCTSSSWYICEF